VIGEGGLLNAFNDVNYALNRDAPDYCIAREGRVLNSSSSSARTV
jgi:hypothetical protein